MHRFLTVALAEEIQQEIATMRDFGYPATHLAQAVKEAASGPRPQGGDGLWLRVGLAVAGGTMALAAARRLGFLGEPRSRSASWCESEDQSLQELRLDHQAPNAIPFSAILVSESEATSHRGCRSGDVDDVIKELITREVVGVDSQPVALCYDMDSLKETLQAMKKAFPPHFLHAIAIKSNPLPFFLRYAVDLGFGLECASIAEVVLALRQGCAPNKIMFDSPAKSKREITFALRHNVQLNADNFIELDRIVQARERLQGQGVLSASHVGVRVNPLMGLGSIKALSVSDVRSKFGIPLNDENRPKIVEQFKKYTWLDSLHIHVGSQGCSMQQHASGAARLAEFVNYIENAVGAGRIRVIDIGGGLPVNFGSDEVTPQYGDYSKILCDSAPALFSNVNRTIVTEYGRSVSAKSAWVVCAVEYVKKSGDGLSIAVIQAGADLFMRTCYCPQNFPLRISTHNATNGKTLVSTDKPSSTNGHGSNGHANGSQGGVRAHERGTAQLTTIAGPLCFGGDKIAEEVMLPEVQEGDFVVVHDAGANTLSTFSRHCSRTAPPVYGYYRAGGSAGGEVKLRLLKSPEPLENVLEFWSGA